MIRGVVLLLIVAACTGCAGSTGTGLPEGLAPWETPNLERSLVAGDQQGLELRVWAIQDQDRLIAELLDTYRGRPTPMIDSERSAWQASGLLPLSIPIDELNLARGKMKLIGPEQSDWLGMMPNWRETVPGRSVQENSLLALADGHMQAPAGRLRLLTRCWVVPTADGPAMQIELGVQLQRSNRRSTAVDLAIGSVPELNDQGFVFPELTSSFLMGPGEALVFVPVSPNFDPAKHIDPEAMLAAQAQAGPPTPAVPTVGEAMLTSVELGGVVPIRRRAIIVLIARLPDEFRLLSSTGDSN